MDKDREAYIAALDQEIATKLYELTYNSLNKKCKQLVEDIAYDFLAEQPIETLCKVKEGKNNHFFRHFNLGMYIRNHYQLWDRKELKNTHPDDVSSVIVSRIYDNLDDAIKVRSNTEIIVVTEDELEQELLTINNEED